MKDFIDFLKLPPNILGALSIASGALLLLPDQLAKRLYMTEFRDKYGFTIGIIFVVSTATMMWATARLWQNTLSVRKTYSVRFHTNCKSISTITLMGMSWKWTTDTYLLQAACSAISKGVMWYRRNANLYRQSWEIQRG